MKLKVLRIHAKKKKKGKNISTRKKLQNILSSSVLEKYKNEINSFLDLKKL